MRIDPTTEAYHDIIWFAQDKNGFILMANSLERGLPEFVKQDSEKTQRIAQMICGINAIDRERKPPINEKEMAEKLGISCYYAANPYDDIYYRVSLADEPLHISALDPELQGLLKENVLPFNIADTTEFEV